MRPPLIRFCPNGRGARIDTQFVLFLSGICGRRGPSADDEATGELGVAAEPVRAGREVDGPHHAAAERVARTPVDAGPNQVEVPRPRPVYDAEVVRARG